MSRTPDSEIFLRKLEQAGGSSGNTALMRDLGWAAEKYWRIRDLLLDEGVVLKGRGKGGSVQTNRVAQPLPRTSSAQRSTSGATFNGDGRNAEADLYKPFAEVLRNAWANERRLTHLEVQVTAFGGKRNGGRWTRPDITVVSKKSFTVVPHSQFDIWTFELKFVSGLDVTAVFEALSHARRATRSFVALEVPEDVDDRVKTILTRCEEEAGRLGIGLITFVDAGDFSTWDERVDAKRQETDGELLEEFLLEQIAEDVRRRIRGWK
jgi:hypothetical protein